jgi:hypothetical protein
MYPAFPATLIMVASVYAVKWALFRYPQLIFFDFHHVMPLLYFAVVGGPVYFASLWLMDRALVKDMLGMLLPRFFEKSAAPQKKTPVMPAVLPEP